MKKIINNIHDHTPAPGFSQSVSSGISLPPFNLTELSREKILDYFNNTWALTDMLFSGLKGLQAFQQPPYHNLRHPLIFYYGHTVVCYVNKFRLAGILNAPINAYYEELFEIGVDEMSWDDLSKNTMQWPELNELTNYRETVYKTITELIQNHPAFNITTITPNDSAWALMLALEHERIHLETSSVLIRELPIEYVSKPTDWPLLPIGKTKKGLSHTSAEGPEPHQNSYNSYIRIPAQSITLGKTVDTPFYGWDNEYGNKEMTVEACSVGKHLVTNGEFLQFVRAQGYHEPRFWPNNAGKWRSFKNVKHPTFWIPEGPDGLHQYQLRTCFEIIPMQWSWPAIVNYYEAKAYCAWLSEREQKNYRLLTEAEHHCLREATNTKSAKDYISGNFGLKYGSEGPVDAFSPNAKGFHDVFGNVWQWMEDHFCPLPGFKVHPYYTDFSTPCFDGEHQMILGGSFISTGDEITPWARFHFRPHFFQHAGFRVVQADHLVTSCMDSPCEKEKQNKSYETDTVLNEYLLLHFGDYQDVVGKHPCIPSEFVEFPKRCADIIQRSVKKYAIHPGRFLDVGCAVGRVCFELSSVFKEVVGIDNSNKFIQTANALKAGQKLDYMRKEEGEIFTPLSIVLPQASKKYSNIIFKVEDACDLPKALGLFDVILMANVLCRVPDPKQCLLNLVSSSGFLAEGGLFILLSPYSWLESFTKKNSWLINSKDAIINLLSPNLELLDEFEMPLLIREHARKFQLIVADGMIWKKKV